MKTQENTVIDMEFGLKVKKCLVKGTGFARNPCVLVFSVLVLSFLFQPLVGSLALSSESFSLEIRNTPESIIFTIEGPPDTPFTLQILDQLNNPVFERISSTDRSGSYNLYLPAFGDGTYAAVVRSGSETVAREFSIRDGMLSEPVATTSTTLATTTTVPGNLTTSTTIILPETTTTTLAMNETGSPGSTTASTTTTTSTTLPEATVPEALAISGKDSFGADESPVFGVAMAQELKENVLKRDFLGAVSTDFGRVKVVLVGPDGGERVLDPGEVRDIEGGLEVEPALERPGAYRLRVETGGFSDEKSFLWGVLVFNTEKNVYLPGEAAVMGMAVLDDAGRTICDANVTVVVTDPLGNVSVLDVKRSAECGPQSVTYVPDYSAGMEVNETGTYGVFVRAETGDGLRTLESDFEVVNSFNYRVTRLGPTRIYPVESYWMNITIEAGLDYSGDIVENVPAGFEVETDGRVRYYEGEKSLVWDADLRAGDSAVFSYVFDAPDVSPYIYEVGELIIGPWREGRTWEIASDSLESFVSGDLEPGTVICSAVDTDQSNSSIYTVDLDFDPTENPVNEVECIVNFTMVVDSSPGDGFPYAECYWNGNLIGKEGNLGTTGNHSISNTSSAVTSSTTQTGNELNVTIFCSSDGDPCTSDDQLTYDAVWVNVTYDLINWWNSSWLYRKEINITNAGSSALTNFPAYLNVSKEPGMQPDYEDLRFINGSCVSNDTTVLDYEIENYTTADADIWVRIPTLFTGITSICMYYGNADASSGENATGVWDDDYKMVHHFQETSGTHYDSTQYGNNGSASVTTQGSANGKIGGADDYESGSSDEVSVSYSSTLELNNFTVEAWTRLEDVGAQRGILGTRFGGDNNFDVKWETTELHGDVGDGSVWIDTSVDHTYTPSGSVWYYVVYVIYEDGYEIYLDGTLGTSNSYSGIPVLMESGDSMRIGNSYGSEYFDGIIDEVRISNTSRTSEWINQTYQIIENQGSFVYFGNQETAPDFASPTYSNVQQNPSSPIYGHDVQCNSTWDDNIGVDAVVFRSNYTGSWANYTTADSICDNQSNVFYCSIPSSELTGLEAVGWNYWANDTSDNWNITMPVQQFAVQKAPTWMNLLLNGTDGDENYGVGQIANITAALNASGVNVQILANFTGTMTDVSNSPGPTPLTNFTDTSGFSPGNVFNITGYFPGNENYTGSSESHLMGIATDAADPVITDVTPVDEIGGFGRIVNINANVTDNSAVDTVLVNITLPDSTWEIYEMVNNTPDIYEYNYTPWQIGEYYYYIWANDTYGNTQEYHPYFYVNGSAVIAVHTDKDIYGPNEDVNLTVGQNQASSNQESGEIQKKAQAPQTIYNEFFDGWESGSISSNWTVYGTNDNRTQVTTANGPYAGTYHLTMDDSVGGGAYSLNEITTAYDFSNGFNIFLSFYEREWGDEAHQCPASWTGHTNGECAAYTCDGNAWYRIYDLSGAGSSTTYSQKGPINISADSNYCSEINSSFAVRLQQYDNYAITDDGMAFDNVNVSYSTFTSGDTEANTSWTTYGDVLSGDMGQLARLKFTVGVSSYDNSGSAGNGNNDPDLQLELATTDGGGWVEAGNFSVDSTGNFTIWTNDSSILTAWETAGNRDLRIRGVDLDYYNSSSIDEINWTGIWVELYNGSVLVNTGNYDVSGYLLMQVHTNTSGSWSLVDTVVNDTNTSTLRNVSSGGYLDVSPVWNGDPWNTGSYENGTYRVYAALTDDEGNVLTNDDNSSINNTYEFQVDNPPTYSNIQQSPSSPIYGHDVQCNSTWDDNIGVDAVVFRSNYTGSWANYTTADSICDNQSNVFYCSIPSSELTGLEAVGWNYWANDTSDNWNITMPVQQFAVQKAPTWMNLLLNGTDGDENYEVDVTANITAALNISGVNVEIWANFTGTMTDVSNSPGPTPLTNFTDTSGFSPGNVFNITGYFPGNENYTGSSESHFLIISADATGPTITDVTPVDDIGGFGKAVNIVANVTDNSGIDTVLVNITLPDSTWEVYGMTNYTQDIYEYNYTPWQIGEYYYYIWANDTYGNSQEYHPYFYVNGSAIMNVETLSDDYVFNEYVNLTAGQNSDSSNQESGEIQKRAQEPGVVYNEFFDGWESGSIGSNWSTYSTTNGRIQVIDSSTNFGRAAPANVYAGTYSVWMDSTTSGGDDQNELNTLYDFSGGSNIVLNFVAEESTDGDEPDVCLASWTGHGTGDCAAFTCDGNTWYRIVDLSAVTTWTNYSVNISADPDFCSEINGSFAVRIQQDDNYPASPTNYYDGIGFDNVNVSYNTLTSGDTEANTSWTTYGDVLSGDMGQLARLKVTVGVSSYDNSGSAGNGNNDPDLQLELATTDGGGWVEAGKFSVDSTGNFTIWTNDSSILTAWETAGNRDLRIRGVDLDYYNSSSIDEINWTGIWVEMYNGSVLVNTGNYDVSGYLLMRIQTNSSGYWSNLDTVVDDTDTSTLRNVSSGGYLDVGSIWNSDPWNTGSGPTGTYRVYAALTDEVGNVLQGDDENYINDTYTFTISLFTFSNVSATPNPQGYGYNVTINASISGSQVDTALVEVTYPNSYAQNFTMTNVTPDMYQYNFSDTWRWGVYSYRIYANESSNNGDFSSTYTFNITTNSTIDVITRNESYGPNEYVNLTRYPKNWWNTSWHYRISVTINTGDYERNDTIISNYFNFTERLGEAGDSGTFDNNSVRVIEYSGDSVVREINSTFENSTNYDAAGNAVGEVIWILNGTNPEDTVRYFHVYFDIDSNGPKSDPGYDTSEIYNQINPSGESVDALNIYGDVGGHFVPANITIETMDQGTFTISIYDKDDDNGAVGPSFYLYRPDGSYYGELGSETDVYSGVWTGYTINADHAGSWHLVINQSENDDEFYMLRTYGVVNLYFGDNKNREVDEFQPQFGGSSTHDHYVYVPEGTTTFTVSNFDMDSSGSIAYYYPNGTLYGTGTVSGNGNWQDDVVTTGGVWGYWIIRAVAGGGVGGYDVLARTSVSDYLWLSWGGEPLWVAENPPSVAKSPVEELDTISKIVNFDTTDTKFYLVMRIQRLSGGSWQNVGFPVIDQTDGVYNVSSGEKFYLDALWNSNGGWNTNSEAPGTYRVYAAMINSSGSPLKDSSGANLLATYNFTIISPYLVLTDLEHENEYEYGVNEYETGDNLEWINVTVTSLNATSINASIYLNILDSDDNTVGWGPNETQYCGDIPEGETCEKRFDNSTQGYPVPLDAVSGSYDFKWNVTMDSDTGPVTQNHSLTFNIYHMPENFSSLINPQKIYQNKSAIYNFTIVNPWSENLTDVNVSINCPSGVGFTCNCTLIGQETQDYCYLENVTSTGSKTASFNVSTNETPAADYNINATVQYTNPGGESHAWSEQGNQVLQVRIPGQLVEIFSYPATVTRGETADLRGYVNNTLDTTMNDVWVNWTLQNGWTNSSGILYLYNGTLAPASILWNNITANLATSSLLGPREIRLDSSCLEGYEDWDTVIITVYANTTILPSSNNSNPVRGETVRISAYLRYENGTGIANRNLTFNDTTTGYFIGWDLTDSGGLAYVNYALSSSETLGGHTINVSFKGKGSPAYANPSWNTTGITVHDKPYITSISDSPDPQGYGYGVTVTANVTDWDDVSLVRVYIRPPGGSYSPYVMTNYTQDIYEYNYTNTWTKGQYSYYVWAQDGAGKTNQSAVYYFTVSSNATLNVKTDKDSYGPSEYVNLTDENWWNDTWNYRVLLTINSSGYQRTDMYVNRTINFTQILDSLGVSGTFDENSTRVVEWNETAQENIEINHTADKAGAPEPDLWDMYSDRPLPVDFNSGMNYTSNTFGAGAGNDGWDWADNVYDDLPTGRPDGAIESNVSSSAFSSNGALRVRIGGIVSGTTEGSGSYESGAFGIQFYVDGDMYRVVQNGGYVNVSYLYSMNATASSAEDTVIYSRFNLNYLGSDQCADGRNDVRCYSDSAAQEDTSWQTVNFNVTDYVTGTGWYYLDFGASFQGWNSAGDGIDVFFDNISLDFYGNMYNETENAVMNVTWVMNGTTPVNTERYYYIYFDTVENGAKDFTDYTLTGSWDSNPFDINQSSPVERPSTLHNSGTTSAKGYLTMKVQRYIGGSWQDVSGGVVIYNQSYNLSSGESLTLENLWNADPWDTNEEPAGTYRALAYLADPGGSILKNDDNSDILGYYNFSIAEPPSIVQIFDIKIYDVTNSSDKHTNTSELVGSGINTTFDLYTDRVYRAEVVLWNNDTSESNWTITSADNVFHEYLDSMWIINDTHDVWYANSTLNYTGGNWSSAKVWWNTSQGDMLVQVGQNATFYYIFNVTSEGDVELHVHFVLNNTLFTEEDYSTYNVIVSEDLPPKLYGETYGLTDYVVNRGDSPKAYARWDEEIKNATAEYNDTSSGLFNHTITGPYTNDWTNRTLNTNTSWLLGNHSIKIYASDLNDNWNETLPYLSFEVWGWASVPTGSLDPATVVQGNPVTMYCRIVSDNTSGISGYSVAFYNSTDQMGTNQTNQTGWARWTFIDNSLGYENIKCNITDNVTLYYNASSDDYETKTLRTIETEPPKYSQVSQNVSVVHKGDAILYRAYWEDNEIMDYAWLSTNETGTWQNSSLASIISVENWANFEITIPMDMNPSVLGWRIYANDSSSNENVTQINTTEVWGWSEVSESYLDPDIIYEGYSTLFSCRVRDLNGSGISGYNVSFYNSTEQLGVNQTNSTGWAVWNYTDYSNGTDTLVCNITDYAAIMYNATSNDNKTETLTTKEPGEDITPPFVVVYEINDTVVWKGESLFVYAQWNESIGNSFTKYNSTSSQIVGYTTETIGGDNWTNHTITTGSSWLVGLHVAKINASDQAVPVNWNNTLPYKTFAVWGRSKVQYTGPTGNMYRGTIPVTCRVIDKDGGYGIGSYRVDFYDNDWDWIDYSNTNSTGYATVNWNAQTETVGPKTLRCLISNNPSAYYNTTAADDDASGSVTLYGRLNVSVTSPQNESDHQVGSTTWLNSTTRDENDAVVTPTANWWNTTTLLSASENFSWSVPAGHSIGPELITVNVTKQYYDPDENNITIYVWGWSNLSWAAPDDGEHSQGSLIDLECRVTNSNTSASVQDYPVKFYVENATDSFSLGTATANSTGYATRSWDTTDYLQGIYYPRCNITDNVTLYYNASQNYEANTTVNITSAAGKLIVELNEPPDDTIVPRYRNFTINATVTCREANCGNVQGTARYNSSGSEPNTAIPGSGTPFYTLDSNPQNCNLNQDENCTMIWIVNATGNLDSYYNIDVLFTNPSNDTTNSLVRIGLVLVLNISTDEIDWGNQDSSQQGIAAPANPYQIGLDQNSNDAAGLYIKGTDMTGTTTPITVGNISWCRACAGYGVSGRMNYTYDAIIEPASSGVTHSVYFWLDTPAVYYGSYSGTLTVMANTSW